MTGARQSIAMNTKGDILNYQEVAGRSKKCVVRNVPIFIPTKYYPGNQVEGVGKDWSCGMNG